MDKKELLKECIEEAIKLGRPYMRDYAYENEPTKEEWNLAMVLLFDKLSKL